MGDLLLQSIRKTTFKRFLKEIVKSSGWYIRDLHLNTGQHTWYEEVDQAVDYLFSLKPEDVGLWMMIGRSGHTTNQVCINPNLSRIYISKPEKVDKAFEDDKAYILKIAQKYHFQEVNKWEDLYPAKNVAVVTPNSNEKIR
jgi:hypothetical protein